MYIVVQWKGKKTGKKNKFMGQSDKKKNRMQNNIETLEIM